jgi:hypothetical protein
MTPMPVMAPADFFGLQVIDIVSRHHRRFRAFTARRHETLSRCNRRLRRGLRARGKRRSAHGYSKGEFQKVAAFHDISLFRTWRLNEESFAASR